MAKPKHEWEKLLMRFPVGTEARFEAVKLPGEERTKLIRELLDRELQRREKATLKGPKASPKT